jgi:PAS domain S-box-containing protein
MHFIGMLALSLPISLRYDVVTTLLSLFVAIVKSGFTLRIAGGPVLTARSLVMGAVVMGSGICVMNYSGMHAVRIIPGLGYDRWLVLASVAVAVAVAASFAALWLAFNLRSGRSWQLAARRLGAAVIMGLGISSMHHLGMAASHFSAGAYCFGGIAIDNQWLAIAISLFSVALLSITLITSLFDARLHDRALAQSVRLREINDKLRLSEDRLRQIADSLPVLISYSDADGICRFANRAYTSHSGLTPEQMWGMTLVEFLRNDPTDVRLGKALAALRGEPQNFSRCTINAEGKKQYWQSQYLPQG